LVNSVRQLLVSRARPEHSLLAVAVADHADVIGDYDERCPFSGKTGRRGLLRSGAHFGDDEFFQLWGLIAARIVECVHSEHSADVAAQ
jgi:hypothetical protein